MRRRLLAGAGGLLLVLPDRAGLADRAAHGRRRQRQQRQQRHGLDSDDRHRRPDPNSGKPAGIAIVVERNGKKQLLVQAARLAPSGQSEGYYVWLYNSPSDAKSLGGQVTDQKGNYQAIGSLPADFEDYKYIDISRQQIAKSATVKHSGRLRPARRDADTEEVDREGGPARRARPDVSSSRPPMGV